MFSSLLGDSSCDIWGDPHFRTLDGMFIHSNQFGCPYTLLQVGPLKVTALNMKREFNGVILSSLQWIEVHMMR